MFCNIFLYACYNKKNYDIAVGKLNLQPQTKNNH